MVERLSPGAATVGTPARFGGVAYHAPTKPPNSFRRVMTHCFYAICPWAAVLALVGCASSPAPVSSAPQPSPTTPATLLDGYDDTEASQETTHPRTRGREAGSSSPNMLESHRFSLRVPVPNQTGWSADDVRERWLVFRHPATSSELRVRTWPAPRLVRREDCEQQVRLWRGPLPEQSGILEQRELTNPPGFQNQLTLAVEEVGGALRGQALVFGAAVGRCYAALYATEARGVGAEVAVAERLSFIVEDVLSRIEASSIDDRGKTTRAPPR